MSPGLMTLIAWLTATLSLALIQDVPAPVGVRPLGPGQPARTESELRAVLETKPSDLAPYLELAHLYYRSGRVEDGEQVLRRALGVHPQTGAVYAAMVMLYGDQTNLAYGEKLAGIAEEWVKAEPTNPQPLFVLGRVHLLRAMAVRGQPAEALMHLDRGKQVIDDAMQLNPNDTTSQVLRLTMAKQRLDLTEDPAERARLQQEIQEGTQQLARLAKAGSASASTHVVAGQPAQPSPLMSKAVRVGGNIQLPTKIKDVKPVYPPEALQARIQGVVIFEIVIDEAGKVAEARILRSIQTLDEAAEAAVRQWEFAPTLVNGTPLPVIMTVTVQFTLPQPQ